jgi:hypothetical protein
MPRVSVALPVSHTDPSLLERAASCIIGQTLDRLELLIILNGAPDPVRTAANSIARADPRVRVIVLEHAGLAAALNVALAEARAPFLARMDADDWCPAHRLDVQLGAMRQRPAAAIGCAFEAVDAQRNELVAINTPPADPAHTRWRLLVENPFAHGSMLMDTRALRAAGGYDETMERAQDYELWHRLVERGGEIYATPEVLYRYTLPPADSYSSGQTQARCAARVVARAMRRLPDGGHEDLEAVMASGLAAPAGSQTRQIEAILTQRGPTRARLLIYTWLRTLCPASAGDSAVLGRGREVCVDELVVGLRSRGVSRVSLWGAGAHAAWVMRALVRRGIEIDALVDDHAAGQERHGMRVQDPASLAENTEVVIASEAAQGAIWEASSPARARGLMVHRLYV